MVHGGIQYSYNIGPVTTALSKDSAMSPKCRSKTEDAVISENIPISSTIHENFKTFIIKGFWDN